METKQSKINLISHAYFAIGIVLIIMATTLIIIAKYPQVWYSLKIHTTESEFEILTTSLDTDLQEFQSQDIKFKPITANFPPLNLSLPENNTILIPKIGVDTKIYDGEDYDTLLEQGVWRVYEFGTPEDENVIILAAHRFGYTSWTQPERNKNSFFNLPNTRVGDRIEIIWKQRKYIYEISKIEESTQITDYSADLILYTCKLYNSPVRIFRYAERTN